MRPWPGGAPSTAKKSGVIKSTEQQEQTHNNKEENENEQILNKNNNSEGEENEDDDEDEEYYSGDFTRNLQPVAQQQQVIVPFDNFSSKHLSGNSGRMVLLEIVGGLLVGGTTGIAGRRWFVRGQQQSTNEDGHSHQQRHQRHRGLFRLRFHHGRLVLMEPPPLTLRMPDQKNLLEPFPINVQDALRDYSKTCTCEKIDSNSKGKCYEFTNVRVIPHVENSTIMVVTTTDNNDDTTEQHNGDVAVNNIKEEEEENDETGKPINDGTKAKKETPPSSLSKTHQQDLITHTDDKSTMATTATPETTTTPIHNSPSTVVVSFDMVSTTNNNGEGEDGNVDRSTQENQQQQQQPQQRAPFWRLRRQGRNGSNNHNQEKKGGNSLSLLEEEIINTNQKEEEKEDHEVDTTTATERQQQQQRHWFHGFWNHQRQNGNEQQQPTGHEEEVPLLQIPPALYVEKVCVEWDDYMKPCFSLLVSEVHYTFEFLTHPPHLKSNWDELKQQGFPPLIPHIPYVIGNIILQGNLHLNVRSRLYQRNLFSQTFTMEDLQDLFDLIEHRKTIQLGQQKGITPIDLADLLEEYFKRKVMHLWKQQPQQREERLLRGSGVVQPVVLEKEETPTKDEHHYREDAIKFVKDTTKTVAAAVAVPMDAISEALPLPEGHHYRQDASEAIKETTKTVMKVTTAAAATAAVAVGLSAESKKEAGGDNNNNNTNGEQSKGTPSAATVTTTATSSATTKTTTTSTSSSTKSNKPSTMLEVVSMPIDAISKTLPLPEGHHYRQDAADFAKETTATLKQFVANPMSSAFATTNNSTSNGSSTQKATSATTTFMKMPTTATATAKQVKKGLVKPLKAVQRTVTK